MRAGLMALALAAGCSVSHSYGALTVLSGAAESAARALPAACRARELAAVEAAHVRADAVAEVERVHRQCQSAAAALEGTVGALRLARDGVAQGSQAPADLAAWVSLATRSWAELQPVLRALGVAL